MAIGAGEGTRGASTLVEDDCGYFPSISCEKLVMDEVHENHREDVRQLVEMMQKEAEEQEKQRGRVAPNMEAGGSHSQAMSVPGRKEIRRMRRVDCENVERKEEEERERDETREPGKRS